MSNHTWHTIEIHPDVRPCQQPHASYLRALLYLLKRSNGNRTDETAEVWETLPNGESALVKLYTGQEYPTAVQIAQAVRVPERFHMFDSQDYPRSVGITVTD